LRWLEAVAERGGGNAGSLVLELPGGVKVEIKDGQRAALAAVLLRALANNPAPVLRVDHKHTCWPDDHVIHIAKRGGVVVNDVEAVGDPRKIRPTQPKHLQTCGAGLPVRLICPDRRLYFT
jgi:hypothetical protein